MPGRGDSVSTWLGLLSGSFLGPPVHFGLGVEEPVQGFSTFAGSVGIHSFVDLGHRIEQAPRCPRQKLTVDWSADILPSMGGGAIKEAGA